MVFGMAAYELEQTAGKEDRAGRINSHSYSTEKVISSEASIDSLYLELTQTDIAALMEIVSKLHNISSVENNQIISLSRRLESMLGINGSALGIYYPSTRENQVLASSIDLEFIPNFGTYPCPVNGVLSSQSERGSYAIFFDGQGENFYTYLCLSTNVNLLQERQKQIVNFILPYLFSCLKRIHLISCRLTEYGLTTREQEVVKWIIEGKDNWSISRILNVSERTVKFHNCNIYKKLGVSAKAEVICEYHKLLTTIELPTAKVAKVGAG